jgi:hypothetical protein
LKYSKSLWLAALLCPGWPTISNAQAYQDVIVITGTRSRHASTCPTFASSCANGGICTDAVFTGKILESGGGKGKAEIDIASNAPDTTQAMMAQDGCTPIEADICYKIGKTTSQEIVAQLAECDSDDNTGGNRASETLSGEYQLLNWGKTANGWGQAVGTATWSVSPPAIKLTLDGLVKP